MIIVNIKIIIAADIIFLAAVAIAVFAGLNKGNTETSATVSDSKIIVIDPGHGGTDPGKVGTDGTREKDINLQISQRLKDVFASEGYEVILTREDDEGLYSESDVNKKAADMRARCSIIEKSKADIVISIHQNSYTEADVAGAQVFYYTHSTEGAKLADFIQAKLKSELNPDNNRVIKANDSYYMLINTPCPTVIVECGFMSNPQELELLCDEAYQEKLAKAIADGTQDYLGN